jgi:hypothetical protein
MNPKQIKSLGLITIFLVALVILIGIVPSILNNKGSILGTNLVNSAKEKIDNIELTSSGNTIKLSKVNSNWKVNDFKADNAVVGEFLDTILKAKFTSVASTKKENYSIFNVQDDSTKLIISAGSEKLANLFVGKSGGTLETYVRTDADSNVYIIDQDITSFASSSIETLRDKNIALISTDKVTQVSNGLVKIKKQDNKWTMVDVQDKKTDNDKASTFVSNATSLKGINIAGDDIKTKLNGVSPIISIEINYDENSTFKYSIYKLDTAYYARNQNDDTLYEISQTQFDNLNKAVDNFVSLTQ